MNAQENMDTRGIEFGFGFLTQEASFDIQFSLIDYDGSDSYARAYKNEKLCYETYGFSAYWNVSNVTDMARLFVSCKFNIDISHWDVSNVTDMSGIFVNSTLNGDISKWNVSNVTNFWAMFE
jgi:surface protein